MRQYKIHASSKVPQLFRRVLKLNTARLNMIEPNLVEGGIETYVTDLYNYFLMIFAQLEKRVRYMETLQKLEIGSLIFEYLQNVPLRSKSFIIGL